MNKITPEIIRVRDQLLIKLSMHLESVESEWNYIEFRQNDKSLEIFSTTEGSIKENRVILRKRKSYLEVCIVYTSGPWECIIAYLDGNDLLKHQTIPLEVEQLDPIRELEQVVDIIKTKNVGFSERLKELHRTVLPSRHSPWQLKLEVQRDLRIKVLRSGASVIHVTFGKYSPELIKGDFIFTLDPHVKVFAIPREIIWQNYHTYGGKTGLGIFELVQADFHRIPDVYYKTAISNSVPLNEFPKIQKGVLSSFTSPLGILFTEDEWNLQNGLPRRIDD